MQPGILSDITVIDMTEGVAGPYAAMALSDMGADVVKVERPAGDWSRPADHHVVDGEANGQFIALNRNKRDIGLDVASAGGKQALARMIAQSDVLISNYRPGVMEKLGFGFEACREINADLVYCTISGFGQTGPYAELPASDTIIQAMSGLMSVIGEPDGPPLRVGFPLIDMAAANAAAQAILLALYGREKGRGGANIDISLLAAAVGMMAAGYTRFMASGKPPTRQGNQNLNLAPAGAFLAGDGKLISIAILRDSHWRKFCQAMELGDLADDPRFQTNAMRVERRALLDDVIKPLLATRPAAEWVERLRQADILCGPINDFADVAADPNLQAVLPLVETMAPNAPHAIGTPIRLDGAYAATRRPAPAKGEHSREVLERFGFAVNEIDRLFASGAAFAKPEK